MSEQTANPLSPSPVISAGDALLFLNRAGAALAASLDWEETLQRVAQLAVPDLADWCAVYVETDDGGEHELTSVHPDPEIEEVLVTLRESRRATEGASETLRVITTGRSVLASDIRGEAAAEATEDQRAAIARLAPKAYMIVPLTARGRVIGSLTLLSTAAGRHYTEADLSFAETLALRCALAIDNARLYSAAERSAGLLDALFAATPVGLAFIDTELRYVRVNDALAKLSGLPVEEMIGEPVGRVDGPLALEEECLEALLGSGESRLDVERSGALAAGPGLRHWATSFTPVRGLDGQLLGVGVTVIDLTERRELLEAEREARVRAHFLAEAGVLLDGSLDYEETLANVARIAVPEVADWCGVSILDADGRLHQVAAAHVDPAQRAIGDEISRRYPPDPESGTGPVEVARTGRTEFVPEVTDEMLEVGIPDPEQRALVRKLGLRSVVIAALTARGRSLGTLTIANAESGRLFDESDVQLAEELARRAGSAIDNARLYTERSRIAHTLQTGLLPDSLPDVPGLQVAARYRAAGELNEVGGDFYDVVARSDGEWAFIVGDVSGKGAEAAVVTALARYTLRALVLGSDSPSRVLERMNTAMLADGTQQFATVVLAGARPCEDGSARLRIALGGHPPALVLRARGGVDAVGAYGDLIGVYESISVPEAECTLGPGDMVVLYTDGVTEAGSRDSLFGQDGLVGVLAPLAGADPDTVADAIERAAVDAQRGEPGDDIAVLVIRAGAA